MDENQNNVEEVETEVEETEVETFEEEKEPKKKFAINDFMIEALFPFLGIFLFAFLKLVRIMNNATADFVQIVTCLILMSLFAGMVVPVIRKKKATFGLIASAVILLAFLSFVI